MKKIVSIIFGIAIITLLGYSAFELSSMPIREKAGGFSNRIVNSFTSPSDTPNSYTADTVIHTNSAGTGLTDTADFVFDGTNLGIGTSTPNTTLTVDSGASATTTVEFGDQYSGTGKTCFNVAQADGSAGSFYFAGGAMVIENNACK